MTGDGEGAGDTRPLTVVIADDQALVRGGFRLILTAAGITVAAQAADGEQAVAAVLEHRPDVVLMDIRMPRLDGIGATRRIIAAWPPPRVPADGAAPQDDPADDRPRIIILTTFDLDEYVYAALAAGASGFLLKDVTPEHLVAAVQLVRTGDALLAPSITRRLVERFAPRAGAAGAARPGGAPPGAPGQGAPGPGSLAPGSSAPAGEAGRAGGTAWRPGGRAWRRGGPGSDMSALTPRELEVLGLVARGMSNAEIAASLFLSDATVKTHVARILTKLGLRDRVQAVVLAYESGMISPGT
jgi:DNA-binding NarL/FixJ family response regulator